MTTDFHGRVDEGHSLAIQEDGKILVSGLAQADSGFVDFAVSRYDPDGSLDQTFGGGDGKATAAFGHNGIAYGMVLQQDGKILLAGASRAGDGDFALARYNPDCSLDVSFDGDGKVTTDFFSSLDEARAVSIQNDGKILAIGTTQRLRDFTI